MQMDKTFYGFFRNAPYVYLESNALSMANLKKTSEVTKQRQLKLLEEKPTPQSLQKEPNIVDILA